MPCVPKGDEDCAPEILPRPEGTPQPPAQSSTLSANGATLWGVILPRKVSVPVDSASCLRITRRSIPALQEYESL